MNETVLILGSAGKLGSDLCLTLQTTCKVVGATRAQADITNLRRLKEFLREVNPSIIVNAAGYTDVDGCESNPDEAFRVNALGARNAAIAARGAGAKLVHVSTDYVFDGTKKEPYTEDDVPHPLSVYGASKLLGESLVKEQTKEFFIVRTAWLYGATGKDFVRTMLRLLDERDELTVVDDQRGSPTCSADLAAQIRSLMMTDFYGTYHGASHGSCSWYEFAAEIFRCTGHSLSRNPDGPGWLVDRGEARTSLVLRPVPTAEFPRPAARPMNSVLENRMLKLERLDEMPEWKDAIVRFLGYNPRDPEGGGT